MANPFKFRVRMYYGKWYYDTFDETDKFKGRKGPFVSPGVAVERAESAGLKDWDRMQ